MSPPFYSEMLFPYQRSYDMKYNLKTITAVRAPDRQIWTFQARAATGFCLCMPEASARHNTSRRHHVLWPCLVRLAFRAANEWRPSSCSFVRSLSRNIFCSRKPLLQLKRRRRRRRRRREHAWSDHPLGASREQVMLMYLHVKCDSCQTQNLQPFSICTAC